MPVAPHPQTITWSRTASTEFCILRLLRKVESSPSTKKAVIVLITQRSRPIPKRIRTIVKILPGTLSERPGTTSPNPTVESVITVMYRPSNHVPPTRIR